MRVSAVIGLGFGDEGKGLTTDYLCSKSRSSLVIRYSGGQQAGHTVVRDGVRHVFSNFGSGTLNGDITYWSKYCTIDPIGIINERKKLSEIGIDPAIFIDEQCPVTTPFDIHQNRISKRTIEDGTCGVGFGETIQRETDNYHLLFSDLFDEWVFNTKLSLIEKYYTKKYKRNTKDFETIKETLVMFKESVKEMLDDPNIMISNLHNIKNNLDSFDHIIFEGSQGLLLDQNIGFFPHVTRSNTGTKNILEMGFNPHLYLVTRCYQTRHGNGPMSNENFVHNIKANPYETNKSHRFQGEFRTTLLDVNLLLYAINNDEYIKNNKNITLVITCLDHIINEYRFTYNTKLVYCKDEKEFVDKIRNILGINDILLSRTEESKNIETIE